MFGNTTIFSNRENASLQCRRFRNIATISQPLEELTELSSKLVKAEIIPLISSNSLFGFLWTINNYTGSKPTSWHADEDVFVNRKKVHSINTQIAFDATFNILDVVAKWPAGSTHDLRILMGCGLRREAPCTSWVSCWVTVAIPARRLDTSQSTTGSS
ncbi:hypothetical protein N1851_019862 [Merluccius polli]|uniref:DDE Tnp4 domain-containing protein n=1 Tax=Merluccius polli TaxID=89951 RepID=A0AA47ML80_MERPO|nr:hypothetical protein N1851_019862 [Merluccius polli]